MNHPASRLSSSSRSSSSSSSRMLCRRRPVRIRSTVGHIRSPFRVLSAAIVHTVLLFATVLLAAAFAHVVGAAEEVHSASNGNVFKDGWGHPPMNESVAALIGHTATNSSSSSSYSYSYSYSGDSSRRRRSGDRRRELIGGRPSDKECDKNPLWSRRVDMAKYDYGCREIEEMLTGDIQLVGSGQVRDVYFAEYLGKRVVVKTLRHASSLQGQKKQLGMHRREVVTLDALDGHPNIVNMLGLCGTTVVTEYFKDNFVAIIHRRGQEMPMRRVASLALDVARGMQALHEIARGAHMDMKPQQLLVDDKGHAKVNDFNSIHLMGLNPDVPGELCSSRAGKPIRMVPWRSPENVAGERITDKADIYSLGMIFYSLLKGAPPYLTEESFKQALINKTRPKIEETWHPGYVKIFKAMWREEPRDRPSARVVVAKLEALLDELP
eukprot:g6639.t1